MTADRTPPRASVRTVDDHGVGQIARALDHDLPIILFTGVSPANYPAWAALVDADGALTEAGRAIEGALG